MFPTLSPHGANYVGGMETKDSLAKFASLFTENWSKEKVQDLLKLAKSKSPRLTNGERLTGYLCRNRQRFLQKEDQRRMVNLVPFKKHRGLRRAAELLFTSRCSTILKFGKVWQWIDTCLCLAFQEDNKHTINFKMRWWLIVAHDVASSGSIHHACKKWGSFLLFLTLHFGGAVQPLPVRQPWFPRFPVGTWLCKQPGELTCKEKARCRILADKRGLPAGDSIIKTIASDLNLMALTKGDMLTEVQAATLVQYSEVAVKAIREKITGDWFKGCTGHILLSNSACFENGQGYGGKRAYILSVLKGWLTELVLEDRAVILPTGEAFVEKKGQPRWKTVKPPGMPEANNLPSGIRKSTGLLTEDFEDGEQERIGFQLFSWSFDTLQQEGYLDHNGKSTGKPMPISRVAIGKPGCKGQVVTRSKAAFIVYGQRFAHVMRELLEHHPALRAGLSLGYQLNEWLKGMGTVPKYVMVGNFESATDHIQHYAGQLSMKVLLNGLHANKNGYASNFINLLLSPRVLEEDRVTTITNSGCLMGEPGTKIVLTFLALVANCYAR
jgi:hypothetical protein